MTAGEGFIIYLYKGFVLQTSGHIIEVAAGRAGRIRYMRVPILPIRLAGSWGGGCLIGS